MGSIIKREGGNGPRYYIIFKDPAGKKTWRAAGTRKHDAEVLLRRTESEIAAGTYGKQGDISFSDFSDKWLSEYAAIKVKPRTYKDYEQVVRIHLRPFFGKQLLGNITPAHTQAYVSYKTKTNLSPRTINKTITVLKSMFKHARIWGYIRENPARFVVRPRETRKEMEYLNPAEIIKLLEAASPQYYPLFATAIMTGARQGELLALRWCDVDLKRRVIFIRRSYHPGIGFTEPKTKYSERTVVISRELAGILKEHKRLCEGTPGELIFRNKNGNPINHSNLISREFHPALERAGLKPIRFHDLRHTYAALIISAGENMKFIQKQLGHNSLTTTMDTYGHLLPEVSSGFGERLDSLIFSSKILPFPTSRSANNDHRHKNNRENGVENG
jgi:integrase